MVLVMLFVAMVLESKVIPPWAMVVRMEMFVTRPLEKRPLGLGLRPLGLGEGSRE